MVNRAIILANGAFPTRKQALQALLQAPLLICCDGAYNKLVDSGLYNHAGRVPEIHVVGDGDSIANRALMTGDDASRPKLPATFVHITDQSTNDLAKAIRHAIKLGVQRVVILGATGLREDHTLGNIAYLADFAHLPVGGGLLEVRMYTDYGFFTPVVSVLADEVTRVTLPSFAGQPVSLFMMPQDLTVSVEGLQYPITRRRFRCWWEATLNQALGDSFTLEVEGRGTVLVYQTHRP